MKRTELSLDCLVRTASVGIACLVLSSSQAAEHNLKTPAGTYEVWICKTACSVIDEESVVVKGHVVLFTATLEKNELARFSSASLRYLRDKPPNACFALEKLPGSAYHGYAGIQESGLTVWSVTGDELKLTLMRSPDAGYRVSVRPTATGFEGEGTSWGAGAAAPLEPGPDSIILRRTGESDIRRCEQMVRDE